MVAKERSKAKDSPKAEVGEIDTRAPFQSVKDAVSLFGEGAFSGERPAVKKTRPQSAERVVGRETKYHLAQKELGKLKEQLKDTEMTKAQALVELEKAKTTVDGLTLKLKTVNELKESAIKATEVALNQTKQLEEVNCNEPEGIVGSWKNDLDIAREQYMTIISEVDGAKQQIIKIRQDYDLSLGAKKDALKVALEAENAVKTNTEKVNELSNEVSGVKVSIEQAKVASIQAHEEQANIYVKKDAQKQSYKAKMEDCAKKLVDLKKEFDPELRKNLDTQLTNMDTEISILQKNIESAKASDLDSVRAVTSELDGAKDSLQKVAEEKKLLGDFLERLKLELENVKKEHLVLKEKDAETESIAGNLNVELQKSKAELEACFAEHTKVKGASDEMISALHQLSSETENAQREAKEMKEKAEELKKESEIARIALEDAETTLKVALEEAEEAKLAELKALDQIKALSEKTSAARASISVSGANIYISKEEMESLSRKVEEAEKLSEMKVAAAMAQVEAVKASENEAVKKLEATQKEIENIKAATQEAVKKAEMAEAAKRAVEGELRRLYERDQKKAAEAASRILVEAEIQTPAVEISPKKYQIYKEITPEKGAQNKKYGQAKSFPAKKTVLPTLSSIFHRKKNQIEGGSPSYLPGEKPI